MARNGSGTYSLPESAFVYNTVIDQAAVNSNFSDIASALTASIAADGQTTVTANLPMNSNKLTGLAVGSAVADSASLGQVQAEAFIWCGTMTGSADAGVLTPSPAITAYAAGQRFVWMASSNVNTGAMTVAISGLSTIAVQNDGSAIAAGDHAANKMYMGVLNTTSTIQIMRVHVGGVLTALNNRAANRLVSIGSTTTELDGEANLTFDGSVLAVAGNVTVTGTVEIAGDLSVTGTATPLNSQSVDYTGVIGDANGTLLHASGSGTDTFTIPANSSVAFVIGTMITFVNESSGNLTIAITSDTMTDTDGNTGSRTLAQHGISTAIKTTATTWRISGVGMS